MLLVHNKNDKKSSRAERRQNTKTTASKQASNNQALRQVMVDGRLVDAKVEE